MKTYDILVHHIKMKNKYEILNQTNIGSTSIYNTTTQHTEYFNSNPTTLNPDNIQEKKLSRREKKRRMKEIYRLSKVKLKTKRETSNIEVPKINLGEDEANQQKDSIIFSDKLTKDKEKELPVDCIILNKTNLIDTLTVVADNITTEIQSPIFTIKGKKYRKRNKEHKVNNLSPRMNSLKSYKSTIDRELEIKYKQLQDNLNKAISEDINNIINKQEKDVQDIEDTTLYKVYNTARKELIFVNKGDKIFKVQCGDLLTDRYQIELAFKNSELSIDNIINVSVILEQENKSEDIDKKTSCKSNRDNLSILNTFDISKLEELKNKKTTFKTIYQEHKFNIEDLNMKQLVLFVQLLRSVPLNLLAEYNLTAGLRNTILTDEESKMITEIEW